MNLLTVSEVAAELRLAKTTIYEMCRTDQIPNVRIGTNGGTIRIPREALDIWLAERLALATSDHPRYSPQLPRQQAT